ncbi:DNA-binding transcriptional regulator, LysR family [Oribacterium sp. KHPX15]|uniref:LysR family transcriptional regulator n=1 Tax=unclassified Oribacterium TaxID=2629782 RepID=UPI0004E27B0E|nr:MULTISPECIES: LysR family transcriptional regulator [unclassified Oribacterium]SEA61501.1 DNA-binding transcriptional regulator, LysR family [Oribacterium sp. KHPX15]
MNVRDYEYVIKIAENQSITKAAAALYITQSALTKYLQRIEDEIGLPLFLRSGHKFLLTDAGREYVETGRVILKLDQDLMHKLNQDADLRQKEVRFGFGMGREHFLYTKVFPRFLKEHPGITLKNHADSSRHLKMYLENGLLDLALVTNLDPAPGFKYIPVKSCYLSLLVPTDSSLINKAENIEGYPFPVVSLSDCAEETFVSTDTTTHSGSFSDKLLNQYLPEAYISMEVSDIRSLFNAVRVGFGIAITLSYDFVGKDLCYLSIKEAQPIEENIQLVYRSDLAMSKSMKDLIDIILEAVKE